MRTAYSYASLIRSMEPDAFNVDKVDDGGVLVFTDLILRGWATDYADPEIDARLGTGYGVPFAVSSYTDLASSTPWTTVTSATATFDTTTDVDLILVIPEDDGNFNLGEYRITAVASSSSLTVASAVGDTGAAVTGDGWIANAPALIRRISAMLAAAHGLDANVAHAVIRTAGRSDDLRTRAFALLDDLKSGAASIAGYPTGTYSGAVAVGQTPDERDASQVFVNRPEDWKEPVEERSS